MVPWKFFIIFEGWGDPNGGISILFFENWICGCGTVFIAASDYALK
jgi:hypothetical protein